MWSSLMLCLKSKNFKFKAKEELFNYSLYIVICKSPHLLAVYYQAYYVVVVKEYARSRAESLLACKGIPIVIKAY